jgi:5-methylcytosine-specific restriction endonuclease McrA
LLGHAVPSGDIAQVFERGLDRLIEHLEKRVFAATARSRPRKGAVNNCRVRHIPAGVRREVWRRDGGRCTFVGNAGQRCPACTRLEFDHAEPVSRGGESTIANLRLRCRGHNQYAAERLFGAGFMDRKRREARGRATRASSAATATSEHAPGHVDWPIAVPPEQAAAHVAPRARRPVARTASAAEHHPDEVIPWLRALGFRADEARQGAAMCEGMAHVSLEERVRLALAGLGRARFRRATRTTNPAG